MYLALVKTTVLEKFYFWSYVTFGFINVNYVKNKRYKRVDFCDWMQILAANKNNLNTHESFL